MRCSNSTKKCVYKSCSEKQNLKKPSRQVRSEVLKHHKAYIPKDGRVCTYHSETSSWIGYNSSHFNYTSDQVEDLIDLLMSQREHALEGKTDAEMKVSTGLTNEQFEILFRSLPTLIQRYSKIETAKIALNVYLIRLRTGKSHLSIAQDFNVTRITVANYIAAAREALMLDFVPNNLGFQHLSRQQLVACNTEMTKSMFCGNDEKVITIWDGTYLYCDKSHNQHIQKQTFSCQKLRNLVKPMVCVAPDGTYVDIFGPFCATLNDAKIMEVVFQKHSESIMNVLQEGDIVLVDRGFRDCAQLFAANGLVVKMPEFVKRSDPKGQLTTKQANKSRLVTANRFVIENRNGHIKIIWQLFDTRLSSYDLVHVFEDYRIGAALINKFFQKIHPNRNDAHEIATKMLSQVNVPNDLAKLVNSFQFQNDIKHFVPGDEFTQTFPVLSKEDLKKISLGTYQISQMNAYCVEHLRSDPEHAFQFHLCPEHIGAKYFGDLVRKHGIVEPTLLLAVLKSRFKANSTHQTFVFVDTSVSGSDGIIAYCCGCRHGLRTVGCCSHVMTVIGYLGYTRHNPETLKETASFLNGLFEE